MKKYYLHNGTEQEGPFDIFDLKNKGITAKTEVWYEGLSDWTEADQIEELKEIFVKSTPPPIKPKTTEKTTQTKSAPRKNKTGNTLLKVALTIVGVICVLYIITAIIDGDSDPNAETYYEQKMTIEETENANPTNFLSIDAKYDESFWGTEIKISGTITNQATVADYKDVVIRVTYYSKTKSVIGNEDFTIYEIFPPTNVKPFKLDIPNYDNVNTIGLDIIRATPN